LASEAVTFARQAEKMLTKDDPPAEQAAVLKVLTSALHKAGKADEAKYLQVRLQKIEETLDRDFLKDAIPFKPEPYGGRKGKSNRVAVVELFTGAQCPPCVAADVAFDALLKTYKPSDVVFLQYHLHVPGPDPLTNSDSEKRSGFYGVRGTPTFYLDGGDGPGVGGPKQASERAYGALQSALNEALESDAKAKLKLKATRKGDKIDMTADYDGLEKPGENMRLLFALVEDVARYQGSNGQRLHHHVVRSLPNGPEGKALEKKSGNQSASVSISDLTKSLEKYLAAFSKKRNYEFEDQPMDLKKLKVVAFIQDNDSKKILQAAQVDLEEK